MNNRYKIPTQPEAFKKKKAGPVGVDFNIPRREKEVRVVVDLTFMKCYNLCKP